MSSFFSWFTVKPENEHIQHLRDVFMRTKHSPSSFDVEYMDSWHPKCITALHEGEPKLGRCSLALNFQQCRGSQQVQPPQLFQTLHTAFDSLTLWFTVESFIVGQESANRMWRSVVEVEAGFLPQLCTFLEVVSSDDFHLRSRSHL